MSSQTTESTRMIEFVAWAAVNKKKLLACAAIIAVGIAAGAIYQSNRNRAEAEASAALLKVDKLGVRPESAP